VLLAAAKSNSLNILSWARKNGCAWDLDTGLAAFGRGRGEVLSWLITNGYPFVEFGLEGQLELCGHGQEKTGW